MQRFRLLPWLFLPLATACAHGRAPLSTTDQALQLDRVVLYQNGVGYFERTGTIDEDVLRLKIRRDQIDDLLKSLTVVDRKSGKAVSVSMPLDPSTWTNAIAQLGPGQGSLASMLDGLRGVHVTLLADHQRIRGRIVMVEEIFETAHPLPLSIREDEPNPEFPREVDHRVTLLQGDELRVIRLSEVRGVILHEGDLALQLHRRLDASAGEGMFQQVEVAVRLTAAKSHDVFVSYVVSAPMWKPTYRVVLPEGEDGEKGQALLQGWAVVDNTSGEDWNDVKLALTSGEPIAFRYDLHTPRTVGRPDLTEVGVRRQAAVAVGETTYDMDADAPAADEVMAEQADGDDAESEEAQVEHAEAKRRDLSSRAAAKPQAAPAPMGGAGSSASPTAPPPAPPGLDYNALRESTLASAKAVRAGGLTRFDVDQAVTVPNGTSTMVAIINESVEAEQTFLYQPGGAGMGYDANPYRVVRFRNTTKFQLEPGPISIYAGGSFVGEGLSEAVASMSSATIPYAVEPQILVSSVSDHSGEEMQLIRMVRGVLEVETFARKRTTWTAKAQQGFLGYTVLIRHPKAGWNFELHEPPKDTEELGDAYLVPLKVPEMEREGHVTVIEQTPSKTSISIWDRRAVDLLSDLLASARLGAVNRRTLEPIVTLRQDIGRIDTRIEGLQKQQSQLDERAEQTRQNLEAIKKDTAAGALRRQLGQRLDEFTREADRMGREIVQLQSERLEKKIRLEDLVQDLDLRPPKAGAAPPKAVPAGDERPKALDGVLEPATPAPSGKSAGKNAAAPRP